MPTVKQIDSYIEEQVVKTWNNRPLYQLVIKIDEIADPVNYYDVGVLLLNLDKLIMIQGIGYVPQISDWITYSTKTSDISLQYERETGYLKVNLNSYSSIVNNSINFYYVKDEGTLRSSLSQEESDYHPVLDVRVNGTTVIDENRIAQIKSYMEVTQEEYDALPPSRINDGIMYCIKNGDYELDEGQGVLDVRVNGESIVDSFGIANLENLVTELDLAKKQNLLVAGNNITLTQLEDGTVRISATGGGGGGGITDVTVNGSSVVSGSTAVITIPTTTSDLTNNSGFIDKDVSNLTNYYNKTTTDNRIDTKIDAIPIATITDKGLMSAAQATTVANAVTGVRVDGTSVVTSGIADIDLSGKQNALTPGTGVQIVNDVISVAPMTGATSSTAGSTGGVPAPAITDRTKFLKGDGTWATPESSGVTDVRVNGISVVDINRIANVNIVHIDYESYWNSQTTLIGEAGHIYVYLDHHVKDGILYPAIKIGDGTGYLLGNPFIGDYEAEMLIDHISDTDVHITSAERTFWNNKVTCYMSTVDNENIIFSKN